MLHFMKKFLFVCLMAIAMVVPAMAQVIDNNPLTVVSSSSYLTPYTGYVQSASSSSNFQSAKNDTLTNGGLDSMKIKISGGTSLNHLHFWTEVQKISGATDSMLITLWGTVETSTGTNFKSLATHQTANTSSLQIFDDIISGNDYTNYWVTVKRIGVGAQVSWYRYMVLFR